MSVIPVKIAYSDNKMYDNKDCLSSTVEASTIEKQGVELTADRNESLEPTVKKLKSFSETETHIFSKSTVVDEGLSDVGNSREVQSAYTKSLCSNDLKRQEEESVISDTNTDEIVPTTETIQIHNMFPDNENLSDTLLGIKFDGILPTITDRYFTSYYRIDVQKPRNDICVRIHSNRICMISLASSHVILQENKTVTTVNFKVSDKLDRASNKVSGKSKHGAQPLQMNSNICSITCSDGETYIIKCCLTGKLVEVNELLLEKPNIVKEPPHKGGYLAIALPNIKLLEEIKKALLTQEVYNSSIQQRQTKCEQVRPEDSVTFYRDVNIDCTSLDWKKRLLKRKWDNLGSTNDVSFNTNKKQ